MTEDTRKNKDAVKSVRKTELPKYIDDCPIDATNAEILRRRHILFQSRVQIADALDMSVEAIDKRYKIAMEILAKAILNILR